MDGRLRLLDPWHRCHATAEAEAKQDLWKLRGTASDDTPRDREILCVMIHGILLFHQMWMVFDRVLKRRLNKAGIGWEGWRLTYPSQKFRIEQLSDALDHLMEPVSPNRPVLFVVHSMGGLVLNHWLSTEAGMAWSRRPGPTTAMYLGSPIAGSEVADWIHPQKSPLGSLFRWLYGPPGEQLKTSPAFLASKPGPVFRSVCVAGSKPPKGFNPMLPGDNDGTVTVASALGPWATRKELVWCSHTFLMYAKQVHNLAEDEARRLVAPSPTPDSAPTDSKVDKSGLLGETR